MAIRCFSSFLSFLYTSRNNLSPCRPNISNLSFLTTPRGFPLKGCLSARIVQRPPHHSVVCMARRYAPNTRLRKIKARKRGGDSKKKHKQRRKGKSKKKDGHKIVRLISDAGTGFHYTTRKGMGMKERLKIRKYDPKAHRHVQFQEGR